MVARRRLTRSSRVALVALVALAACKKPPPPPSQKDAGAHDRLAPGEFPEGKQKAYALALPLASSVRTSYGGTVGVVSELSPEQLANFVRTRVKEGKVVAGTSSTRFEDVVVPAEPNRRLTIHVRPTRPDNSSFRSEMTVEDTTPPPLEPGLSDEERWRKAGYGPNGQIDKTRLH